MESPDSESDAMCEIRRRLAKQFKLFPAFARKFSLQRWLEEYDSDVDAVIPKLRWTLNTLRVYDAHRMDTSTISAVNRQVLSASPISEFFPGGLMGYDRQGNVTFVQPFGRLQPARLMAAGNVSQLYRMLILEAYGTHQLICAEEQKRGERRAQIAILDMDCFSWQMIYMPAIRVITNIFGVLQLMFPGIAKKIFLINVHPAVAHGFRLVQAAFTRKTTEGIEFVSGNWRERLIDEIGEENVLPHWGGKMHAETSTGEIRMGGAPPPHLRITIPECGGELSTVKIPAAKSSVITVVVERPLTALRWYFKATKGDVDFCIRHDGDEVVPCLRLCTQLTPEFGEIVCQTAGAYEICFGNAHSTFWNNTVHYKFDLCVKI